jgi:biotin operon repressor
MAYNKYATAGRKYRIATAEELPRLVTRKQDALLIKLLNKLTSPAGPSECSRKEIAQTVGLSEHTVTVRIELLKQREQEIDATSVEQLLDAMPYGVVRIG